MQRNLPEIASPFTRSPPLDDSYTAFPLRDEHRGNDRAPSWESHSRFELERDITNMRTMNRTLGEAASWILDALRNNDTTDPTTTLRREKALDSLSYLRDALRHGSLLSLDEGKLFDEEAMKSRRMRAAPSPSDSPTNHQDPQALNPRHFAKPRTTQHPLSPSFSGPSITPPANHHPMVPRGKHKPQYVTSNHVPSNTYKPPPQAGIKTISVSTIPDSSPPLRRRSEEVPKKSADNGLDPLGVLH
jgi:TBC1 domain family protein 5